MNHIVTLTGFADEISSDLEEQLNVLESEGMRHFDLRGVWGKNVLQLTDDEVTRIKQRIDERGIKVACIGSPIGKIEITDDFAQHLKQFERAVQLADRFGSRYIRIFSFFIPDGQDPSVYRDEVMARMGELTRIAEREGVMLVHENESRIYGDTGNRCHDILTTIRSKNLACAFDPANFVHCGVQPMQEAYPQLESFIDYIHIKDMLSSGKIVPAGEGDGEIRELLEKLKHRGYNGFMSLEPHLQQGGTFQGFSGPELFVTAVRALKKLLSESGFDWD